jgi:biopolymer transport protein ExbD
MSKSKQIEGSETRHYVSARKKRGQKPAKAQPPLTPMIDVTFQLLLYFLLTAQFREEEGGIPGTLPNMDSPSEAVQDPREPIRVYVETRGLSDLAATYRVDRMVIEQPSELARILAGKREQGGNDPPSLIIAPVGNARWQFILEVFNASVKAGFDKIGFQSGSG